MTRFPATPVGLSIWCNANLPPAAAALLRRGVAPHDLLIPAEGLSTFGGRGRPDPLLSKADIAFGQPDPDQVLSLPRLRWVHLTSAGYTPYDREDLFQELRRREGALTEPLVYDEPCAQHLLAFLCAQARQLPAALSPEAEGGRRVWPQVAVRARSRLLGGQTVVLVGFGSIARRLVELLAPLRMEILALRRTPTGDERVPTFALEEPDGHSALARADHVVDILPAAPTTAGFFDAARLGALKAGAVFYNIGRGTTVDQDALSARLASGHLAAAYLDVTDPEPLPPEHPLWSAPNCFITPHSAGGHQDEAERLVAHFMANFVRYTSGRELLDRLV